jgi:hypothetical protein
VWDDASDMLGVDLGHGYLDYWDAGSGLFG